MQESGGKNCAISTADVRRQSSDNSSRMRAHMHASIRGVSSRGWLYRRTLVSPSLNLFRITESGRTLVSLSLSLSRHVVLRLMKKLLARKYRRQTDKTKPDASALSIYERSISGLYADAPGLVDRLHVANLSVNTQNANDQKRDSVIFTFNGD